MGAKKAGKKGNVNIDESMNIVHEIPTRWEYTEKQVRKLWYTKADIRKSRQEHQEEVMMEQVKVVVEKRLAEEGTPERLDDIMSWPPTQILMYLETPVVKRGKSPPKPIAKPITISDDDIMDLFSLDISKTLASKGKTPAEVEADSVASKAKPKKQKPNAGYSSSSSSSSSDDDSSSSSSDDDSSSSSSSSSDGESSSSSSSDSDSDSDSGSSSDSSSSSESQSSASKDSKSKPKKSWFPKSTTDKYQNEDENEIISVPGRIPQRSLESPKHTPNSPVKPSDTPKESKKDGSKRRSKKTSATSPALSPGKAKSPKGGHKAGTHSSKPKGSKKKLPPPPPPEDEQQDTQASPGYESGSEKTEDSSECPTSPMAIQFKHAVQNVQATVAISSYLKSFGVSTPGGSHLDSQYVPSDDEMELHSESVEGDECPICLGLVEGNQTKKIILVAQMLCAKCLKEHEEVIGGARIVMKEKETPVSSTNTTGASSPKPDKKKKKKTKKGVVPPSKEKNTLSEADIPNEKSKTKGDDASALSATKKSSSKPPKPTDGEATTTRRTKSGRRKATKSRKSKKSKGDSVRLGSFAQLVQKRDSLLEAAMEPEERMVGKKKARDSPESKEEMS